MTNIKKLLELQLEEVETDLECIKSNPDRVIVEREIHLETVKTKILVALQKYEGSETP